MENPLLTSKEVASMLKVSERTVWRLADAGAIPRRRVGKRAVRFAYIDVIAYLRRSREEGTRDA